MARRNYIGEVVSELRKADGDREIIERILKKNFSKALLDFFRYAYDSRIVPLMTEADIPEYRPDPHPYGLNYSNLFPEYHRFRFFFTVENPNFSKLDLKGMQRLYINICERIHREEAEIFTDVVLNRLYIKGVDAETINRVYGSKLAEPEKAANA